jgi:hypothetical protein
MKISNFVEMLEIMGYEVIVRAQNDNSNTFLLEAGFDRKRVK